MFYNALGLISLEEPSDQEFLPVCFYFDGFPTIITTTEAGIIVACVGVVRGFLAQTDGTRYVVINCS